LGDEHWRVAEMCVKVCARREIGAGGPGVAALAGHELARVRSAVARALGLIGDTEHQAVLRRLLDDPERAVQAAAQTAFARMDARLDLAARPDR
jgi:HEAT repeat protein